MEARSQWEMDDRKGWTIEQHVRGKSLEGRYRIGDYGKTMRNNDNLKGTQQLMKCLQWVSRARVRLGVSPGLEEP